MTRQERRHHRGARCSLGTRSVDRRLVNCLRKRKPTAVVKRSSYHTETADVGRRNTQPPVVITRQVESLTDEPCRCVQRTVRVDDALWFACRAARGNDECVTLDEWNKRG
ncbi:MAG: hypothetical protein EBY86_03555 [Acidimicrobiia bacterium]|nr:hypothetical protein [Acidimicrobiia bacterium]